MINRQVNRHHPGSITFYFNYDVLQGCPAVFHKKREIRPASPGSNGLGLIVIPRPLDGFVHYQPAVLKCSRAFQKKLLVANQTTLVDITLRRIVHQGVFELDRGLRQRSFKHTPPGAEID